MESPLCTVEFADQVATLTLDRPANGNALTEGMACALDEGLALVLAESARAVVVRGTGRHLCSGGDIDALAALAAQPAAERVNAMDALLRIAEPMVRRLAGLPVPLVLACRGVTAGGGLVLPLAADVVLADESATFRFSHLAIGVPPDAGVSWLLPRLVGRRRAFALVARCAVLGAAEARALGIVTQICPAGDLWEAADQVARTLAEAPAHAMRATKRLLAHDNRDLATQLAAERAAVLEAVASESFPAAVQSLLDAGRSARG